MLYRYIIAFTTLISFVIASPAFANQLITFAGGHSDDGLPATQVKLEQPDEVVVDSLGNIYILQISRNRIRKVDALTGIITTVVGNGNSAFSPDGTLASEASLSPSEMFLNNAAQLYFKDYDRIRTVDPISGGLKTVAGQGEVTNFTHSPRAFDVHFTSPIQGLFINSNNHIFFSYGPSIYKIDALSRVITPIITITESNEGVGDIWLDKDNSLYYIDKRQAFLKKFSSSKEFSVLFNQRGRINSLCVDSNLNLYFTYFNTIQVINQIDSTIATAAGGSSRGFAGDQGVASESKLANPTDVTIDKDDNIYIADRDNNRIRKIDKTTGIITTVAGGGVGDGIPATNAPLLSPQGIYIDRSGNFYLADKGHHRIRYIDRHGIIKTIAGTGQDGYSGDQGPATEAMLNSPSSVVTDANGNIYISDTHNHRIRKIDAATGVITTVGGDGNESFGGDGGPATLASLAHPIDICLDTQGNIFVADKNNHRIRRIDHATNEISTIAGDGRWKQETFIFQFYQFAPEQGLFRGDGDLATKATLVNPIGIFMDKENNLYISDSWNHRIRKVDISGIITTVAGNGKTKLIPWTYREGGGDITVHTGVRGTFSGDGGSALNAGLNFPNDLWMDTLGNIYFSDASNRRVRKIDATTGAISTIISDIASSGLAIDSIGNIYISDTDNHLIRKLPSTITKDQAGIKNRTSDFDQNGTVDFIDFLRFIAHFDTHQNDTTFDTSIDLNDDGSIDFLDFLLFVDSFGEGNS